MVYETTSMGFELKFNGPDTVEDYDRAAGKVGSCLEDACTNTLYRSTLPEFQDAFVSRVEALTGMKREVNAEATAAARARSKTPDKVKDIKETVARFVKRATAGMSNEDKAGLQSIAQEVADGIKVDPSPAKRAAAPKQYLAKADSWLTLDESEREAKITKALDAVEGFELDRDENNAPDRNSLGQLIQQYVETLL